MTAQVHWGVTVPMICQVCHRPADHWYTIANESSGPKSVVVIATCHGATETQQYDFDAGHYIPKLHPAVAFPMPTPWPPFVYEAPPDLEHALEMLRSFGMTAQQAFDRMALISAQLRALAWDRGWRP